jgi:hypothetical protein
MASSPSKVEKRRPGKHDAFVSEKIADAISRIRTLEITVGICGLFVGVLVYGQVLALIDMRLLLPEVVRQLLLGLFLGAAGVWSYLFIYRPWRMGINPYYAAQVLEANTPGTQNGALNWLDMRDIPEASHARGLVGQRAAKELSKADLERAISGERATWTGAAAVLLFLFAFILALLVGPRLFLTHLNRVYFPYSFSALPSGSTHITIVWPEGGDVTVVNGEATSVKVHLEGRVPAATDPDVPKIRYRHDENEPWSERPLKQQEEKRKWDVDLSGEDIQNGIQYYVTAGNATTEYHRISTEAPPLIEDFQATYFFRQYTGRTKEVRRERPIEALVGTAVELRVKTNRTLAADTPCLELTLPSGAKRITSGTILPDDPTAFSVKLTLEESGRYRLHFANTRRINFHDADQGYELKAIRDEPPTVELTHPGRDVALPANALLPLEGWAADDIGLKNLTLRLRVLDGSPLQPKVYRELDSLKQKHGNYPTYVKYKEFLDLTKLREGGGKVFTPKVGQKIEYWLEASDACDLPGGPHVVPTKHYRIEVVEADPDTAGQGEQRKQAGKDKADHDKQQDQAFAQEDAARKEDNDRKEKGGQQGGGGNDPQQGPGQQGNGGGGQGQNNAEDNNTLNQADKLNNALDNQEKKNQEGQGGQGGGTGKEQKKEQGGESKEGGEGKQEKKEQGGESKEGATGEQKNQAGQGKEKGNGMNMAQNQPAEKKEGGQQGAGENKPEGKEGGQQGMGQQGMNQAGESKPGEKQGENKPGQGKEQQNGQGNASERKEGNAAGKEGAAQGKENGGQGKETAGENKTPPTPGGQPSEAKSNERGNPQGPPAGKEQGNKTAENNPAEQKAPPEGQPQGTSKPGAQARDMKDPRQARPEDVERLKNQAAEPSKERSEAAGKELDRIQKEANDPAVREAAKEALDEMKQNAAPCQCKKGGGTGAGMADGGAEAKPGAEGMAGAGDAKPQPGMGQQGQQAEAKENGGMGGNPMKAENAPVGKERGNVPGGGALPGMGQERTEEPPMGQGQGNGPEVKPEKAAPAPATELQLQKFKNAVNPDILKDLRMSPEEFERFLKKYEDLAKRTAAATEKVPGSQAGAGNLPALGGANTPTTPGTQPTGPGLTTRPLPPPGYREANKEFLRQLAQPDR